MGLVWRSEGGIRREELIVQLETSDEVEMCQGSCRAWRIRQKSVERVPGLTQRGSIV